LGIRVFTEFALTKKLGTSASVMKVTKGEIVTRKSIIVKRTLAKMGAVNVDLTDIHVNVSRVIKVLIVMRKVTTVPIIIALKGHVVIPVQAMSVTVTLVTVGGSVRYQPIIVWRNRAFMESVFPQRVGIDANATKGMKALIVTKRIVIVKETLAYRGSVQRLLVDSSAFAPRIMKVFCARE